MMKNKKVFNFLTVIFLAAVLLLSTGCFNITVELATRKNSEETPQTQAQTQTTTESYVQNVPFAESTAAPTETLPEASADAAPTAPSVTAAAEENVSEAVTPDALSGEKLLAYFNDAANAVKSEKAGFTKTKLTSVADLQLSNSAANALVGIVKSSLLSETEDVTNVKKGEDSSSVMSPSGKAYVSQLTMADITDIKCEKSGSSYVITVSVKGETNPASDSSICGRIFDFITVGDVITTYAPKVGATVAEEDIEVVFSDCKAILTVDAQGSVTAYETYVKANMILYNAKIKKVVTISTDLDVTLVSTTKYTQFSF